MIEFREIDHSAARVIAVANQKGGVGKTTTAINLSACLAHRGARILLVDFDPQFNSTSGLGRRNINSLKNIYRVLIGEIDIHDAIVSTDSKNLDLLPSSLDLSGMEAELGDDEERFTLLKTKLEPVLADYALVFIDCPPSLGILTINALYAANSILIPIQCEYYALEGLTQLLRTVERIRQKLNPVLETEGILLTMCDTRTNLANQVVSEVRRYFPDKVYSTVIPRNVRLSEAPGFGKSIIDYDLRSQGAESYISLAGEFITAHHNLIPPEKKPEPSPIEKEVPEADKLSAPAVAKEE